MIVEKGIVFLALCMVIGIINLCLVFMGTSKKWLLNSVITVLIIGMGVVEGKADAATKGTYHYNDSFSSVYEGELNEKGLPDGRTKGTGTLVLQSKPYKNRANAPISSVLFYIDSCECTLV
ncbi:hypothetical protein ABC255_02515 [Neobacillus sp. 3P2-tot-E-2]|uniref:hypothetical protein n=1 Tax=Neobacillus sp. 3P2-tot-E-2 TaxID=3132212 RepID=UPI0039A229B3